MSRRHRRLPLVALGTTVPSLSLAFAPSQCYHVRQPRSVSVCRKTPENQSEEWSDFEDLNYNTDNFSEKKEANENLSFGTFLQDRSSEDLTAIQQRQFSLGPDLVLEDYVGSMGFDQVTDWEYYMQVEDEEGNQVARQVVDPPPLDPSKPKRTRSSSGSVVRLFRGEFAGLLGNTLRSQGRDRRLLVKEFSGALALELARAELSSVGKLQSDLLRKKDATGASGWVATAVARSVKFRQDHAHVCQLVEWLGKEPYAGILGEVNLAELEGAMDPNEFYRALGVTPPKPGAVWLVYEYTGLVTLTTYCRPALQRRANLPMQRGFFGQPKEVQSLPPWNERANYVTKGIMKQALEALAILHETGIAHRSIGRSSVLLSSVSQDKREASSPFATVVPRLVVKLTDLGFSCPLREGITEEDFVSRARNFGVTDARNEDSLTNFAVAEDLHALGFVFLGLLLTSLAEIPTPEYNPPDTSEDTLQRLLADIFEKDMEQFRDYVEAEEVWSNVVDFLDEKDGWRLLESLCFARENAGKGEAQTARELLSSPLFQ